jgi:hypothetical protein
VPSGYKNERLESCIEVISFEDGSIDLDTNVPKLKMIS